MTIPNPEEAPLAGAKVAVVVSPSTIVINRGSEHGVRLGQRFLIYTIGEKVVDPDTRESLGRLELVRGTGKVVHLQERMCTVSSDMKRPAGRTVRRSGSSTLSLWSLGFGGDVEEHLPAETVPFDDVAVGNLAKPV